MTEEMYVVPSPEDSSFVNLSKQQSGKLFTKQIFKMGSQFVHPGDPTKTIKVDEELAKSLVHNFETSGNIVQVPLVNDANAHVEDPDRNLGEVIGLDYDDKGIYATIDARKNADNFGKTYLGASAFLNLNYKDTTTGEPIGPTLLHVAVTNRPYLTNLSDYTETAALSADTKDDEIILLTLTKDKEIIPDQIVPPKTTPVVEPKAELPIEPKETPMDMDSVKAWLKEQGFDFDKLQSDATLATELSAKLDAVNEELKLSAGNAVTIEAVGEAMIELSADNKALEATVNSLKEDRDALKLSAAENEVDKLISTGRVLPAQKDVFVKLSLTDRETFTALVPDHAIVKLSESGVTIHEDPTKSAEHQEHITRYRDMAVALTKSTKR